VAHRCPLEDVKIPAPPRCADPEVLDEPQGSGLSPARRVEMRSSVVDRPSSPGKPGEHCLERCRLRAEPMCCDDNAQARTEPQGDDGEGGHDPAT